MPIYRHRCTGCKHEHEIVLSMDEGDAYKESPQICPNCKEEKNQTRLLGGTSFKLAGTGWYRDNYR